MEETNRLALLTEMTSLETAVQHLKKRIKEIASLLQVPADTVAYFSAPKNLKPLPEGDTTVLGRDRLGRIKRTRKISPELREKKQKLITVAREAKLARIRELRALQKGNRIQ